MADGPIIYHAVRRPPDPPLECDICGKLVEMDTPYVFIPLPNSPTGETIFAHEGCVEGGEIDGLHQGHQA